MNNKEALILFKGDDTTGALGRTVRLTLTAEDASAILGATAVITVGGVEKRIVNIASGTEYVLEYSASETDSMPLGGQYGEIYVIDAAGNKRTLTNTLRVLVTNNVGVAYAARNDVEVAVDTGIAVVTPDAEAEEGQAADAKATFEALEGKRDKTDLVVYNTDGEATGDALAKTSEVWLVGGDDEHNKAESAEIGRLWVDNNGSGGSIVVLGPTDGSDRIDIEGDRIAIYNEQSRVILLADRLVLGLETPTTIYYTDLRDVINGASPHYLPRYGNFTAAVVDGTVTLLPYSRNSLTSDGTAFTVAMGGSNTHLRDCVFVVTASDAAPNISWGVVGSAQKFSPRTDAATDLEIAANTTKVFWVTEYARDQFAVAGWEAPNVGE